MQGKANKSMQKLFCYKQLMLNRLELWRYDINPRENPVGVAGTKIGRCPARRRKRTHMRPWTC